MSVLFVFVEFEELERTSKMDTSLQEWRALACMLLCMQTMPSYCKCVAQSNTCGARRGMQIVLELNPKSVVGSGRQKCIFRIPFNNYQPCKHAHLKIDYVQISLQNDAACVVVSLLVLEIRGA